jgi:hypothetical protein
MLLYRDKPNLKAAGVPIAYTKEQLNEYIKCSKDPLYFIKNYAKIVSLDKGIIPFSPFPYQERIIKTIHNNKNTLAKLFRQAGKALPLFTEIPTPTGFMKIKDIHIGDQVFDSQGNICNVIAESKEQELEMYYMKFDTGEHVISCKDHQWVVFNKEDQDTPITCTTLELLDLINGSNKYIIKNTKPVNYPEKIHLIEPYEYGYAIGLFTREIPQQYLFGGIEKRIALVQGIMDAIGKVAMHACSVSVLNHKWRFIESFKILLQSLGLNVKIKYDHDIYRIITLSFNESNFPVFRNSELQSKLPKSVECCKTIISISEIPSLIWGKCIQVDSPDSTYLCTKEYIPTHNSTIVAGYFAWYTLFNDNKTSIILANKQQIAIEIFSRVQFIIEHLPIWLQQGVLEWNKKSLVLENGSRCLASATSISAIRGMSANMILLDEFAHLLPSLADEFIASVFPTLSSSESSKLVIVSTPNGLNHYHKLWIEAINKNNDFVTVEGHWSENPTRNQKWADEQLLKLGEVKYRQEIECSFEGSSYTLISGVKLATLPIINPLFTRDGLEIYKRPEPNTQYVITVDVARGTYSDYTAFSIFDISEMPYEIVAIYKNNLISTLEFPHLLYNMTQQYNNAYLLIELNDLGEEVSNIIWYDYEYENIYFTTENYKTRNSQLSQSGGKPGIRTTLKVKSLGCSILKELVEKDQLIINSYKIIEELGVFVVNKRSYQAINTTINDDLVTTLWLFAWLTKQTVFQQLTDINLRQKLTEQKQQYIDSTLTPFGFYDNGFNPIENQMVDNSRIPEGPLFNLTDDQNQLLR